MPSLELTMAWAINVHPVYLGASLDAYHRLNSALTMLRLCHRFGTGHLARLPAEVFVYIEDYVFAREKRNMIANWSKNYRCWQATCKPSDHFDWEECREIYYQDYGRNCEDCGEDTCPYSSGRLNDQQMDFLNELLENEDDGTIDEDDDGNEEDEDGVIKKTPWRVRHNQQKFTWTERVGDHDRHTKRDFLSRIKELVLRDFGLETWISHTQPNYVRNDQRMDNNVHSSTVACIIMPECNTFSNVFGRRISDETPDSWDDPLPDFMPTECGYNVGIRISNRPSKSAFKRFPRALKILSLQPSGHSLEGQEDLYASLAGVERTSDNGRAADTEANVDHTVPQLRLLARSRDMLDDF